MPDNIGRLADGRASFAFRGDRADIWHRKGNQYSDTWTLDDWALHSGLNFIAAKVPAIADMRVLPPTWDHALEGDGLQRAKGRHFIVRTDSGHILSPGTVSDQYQIVQPFQVLDWFQRYCGVDDAFQLDVAGALHGGEVIWASAVYNGPMDVAGERHKARLLMTTSFDGSGATVNRGCVTRVVCNNTLDAALGETSPTTVRTRHNTAWDAEKVGNELAAIVASFHSFKAMGEAMARVHWSNDQVSRLFKSVLSIDPAAQPADVSKAKMNKFEELVACYHTGVRHEGLQANTPWAAIQGITRYADHARTGMRGTDGTADGLADMRFASGVVDATGFGSRMKASAIRIIDDLMDGALRAAADKAKAAALAL